jgi:hypothetical protein
MLATVSTRVQLKIVAARRAKRFSEITSDVIALVTLAYVGSSPLN